MVFLNQLLTCKYLIIILNLLIELKVIVKIAMPVLFMFTYTSDNLYKSNNNHMKADTMPELQELN